MQAKFRQYLVHSFRSSQVTLQVLFLRYFGEPDHQTIVFVLPHAILNLNFLFIPPFDMKIYMKTLLNKGTIYIFRYMKPLFSLIIITVPHSRVKLVKCLLFIIITHSHVTFLNPISMTIQYILYFINCFCWYSSTCSAHSLL